MKRKTWERLSMLGIITTTTIGLVACQAQTTESPTTEVGLKIGMVTDSGTIDDKSFNQGTWEGILKYTKDHEGVESRYIQPKDGTTQSFVEAIDNLVLSGHEVIVTPGFSFEEAIGDAQAAYPEVKFVLIDGQPLVGETSEGDPVYVLAENTVSISFTEQEAGFLAGVASALESKQGKLAFLGGEEIPAVQKLGWGFVAGVAYANQTYGTNAHVEDFIYQLTFTETDAGKAIAGGLYDKGVDIIFHAAGAVGVGAINEARTRSEAGESVYVVGVDVDQYDEGMTVNGNSVILTSAMKQLGNVTYQMLEALESNEFPGGQALVMDVTKDAVGLPDANPNLGEETLKKIEETLAVLKTPELIVPDTLEGLKTYLTEMGYSTTALE